MLNWFMAVIRTIGSMRRYAAYIVLCAALQSFELSANRLQTVLRTFVSQSICQYPWYLGSVNASCILVLPEDLCLPHYVETMPYSGSDGAPCIRISFLFPFFHIYVQW